MKILNVGVSKRENGRFVTDRVLAEGDYSFILFKSRTVVIIDTSYVETESGTFMLADASSRQYYRPADGAEFVHDFITLRPETEEEKRLIGAIPVFRLLRAHAPEFLSAALTDIHKEQISNNRFKWQILPYLCDIFLYRVQADISMQKDPPRGGVHYERLNRLRGEIYSRPGDAWTVESMSRAAHLSASYFQYLYKEYFAVSCMNDVICARMELAEDLLKHTGMKVSEIAEQCGYRNVEHFIRQFKSRHGGEAPLQYSRAKF